MCVSYKLDYCSGHQFNDYLFFNYVQEFNDWVIKYVTINDDIIKLRDRVYLNLMMLDVSEVNQHLKNIIKCLKNKILDYYMNLTKENISG